MNFNSEKNKPVFVARPQVWAANESRMFGEGLSVKAAAARGDSTGDYMLKIAEARKVPDDVLVKVANSTVNEIRDLVVRRLKTDAEEKFEFLDGRVFSGAEAAEEVRRATRIGDYFLELEKETLQIVQDAYFKGKI